MSDGGDRDARWVIDVARTRGVTLDAVTAHQLAALVTPTLDAFAEIIAGLCVDDDEYEFLRVLTAEAGGA